MSELNSLEQTDTAHLEWQKRWQTEEGRADWLVAEPDVAALVEEMAKDGPKTALDLGCGVGRHALAFARAGFKTHALDLADAGLAELGASAKAEGLDVETHLGPMNALPFDDDSFDYVLSFNVIYHGDPDIVRQCISEIMRVLKPGGIYQGTMLSKRNVNYGKGREIAPDTWVNDSDDDKAHPHFYCNAKELVALYDGFELRSLQDKLHKKPGSWHWHLIADLTAK